MTANELLETVEPGDALMVANESFFYAGQVIIQLDGGDVVHWLFDEDENMLSVAPETEEMLAFRLVVEEFEPEDDVIMYRTHPFELSYEDAGAITNTEADVLLEEEDRYEIFDYESEDGALLRIITNETTGESRTYFGSEVFDDDIQKI